MPQAAFARELRRPNVPNIQGKSDGDTMTYQAPVDDILHALKAAADLDDLIAHGLLDGVDEDTIRAVINEAGKFGAEVLDPLSAPGDRVVPN